jgi:sugar lactone lactonase YvrE
VIDFKALNDVRCELGEGPLYDDRDHALFYCDIEGRALHRVDLATKAHQAWQFPGRVCSTGLAESGRVVVSVEHTVGLFDIRDESFVPIAEVEADRGADTRLNDGKVGPDGAFWVGTMDARAARPRQPIGALYRVTVDGRVEKKVAEIAVSNGLAFSPDGRSMFHADTNVGRLDRWTLDPASGALSDRRQIAVLDEAAGRPDGGATDADGNYWSAGISAQCLNHLTPAGRLIAKYALPVFAPTMPCFGGTDLQTLFVTSLRAGRPAEKLAPYPLTGIVIAGHAPVSGAPVSRFRDR